MSTTASAGGPIPPPPVGPQVELVDGGVIAGGIVSCDETTVGVENLEFGRVRLPRTAVAAWRASLSADRDRSQRPVPLVRIARDMSPRPQVAVLLDNDDVAAATVVSVEGNTVRIGIDGVDEPVTIPLERVRTIAFLHDRESVRREGRPPATLVALRDGSRIAVEPLPSGVVAGGDDSRPLRLVLSSPAANGLAVECPREAIVATADRGTGVRSLEHEEIAGDGGRDPGDPPERLFVPSRSLSGGPLRARGENAFGGFSMRAPGKLTFVIRRPADRFEGRVAIDDSAGQAAAVRVKLRAGRDGGPLETVFESGPIRSGDAPLAIAADAPGMERLEIAIEGGDRLRVGVLWLDPVVISR